MDGKMTFKTWTVLETIAGGTGFIMACIISAVL
jgi:H+/gluconate symporter-like permease